MDANVVASAFAFGGTPRRLIESARRRRHVLIASQHLLTEIERALNKQYLLRRLQPPNTPASILALYRRMVILREPREIPAICRDPDDYNVLACAVTANADWLVTGDGDLLALGKRDPVEILTPADALARISG